MVFQDLHLFSYPQNVQRATRQKESSLAKYRNGIQVESSLFFLRCQYRKTVPAVSLGHEYKTAATHLEELQFLLSH